MNCADTISERAGVPVRPTHGNDGQKRPSSLACASLFLLLAVFLAGGCATTPQVWREPSALSAEAREARNLRVFERAAEVAESRFFDVGLRGVDWAAARERHRPAALAAANDAQLYTAVNALLSELGESHTVALRPREHFEHRNRQRTGAGFRMRRLDGRWIVTEVIPGSAAEAAGVQRGWIVRRRDGVPLGVVPYLTSEVGQTLRYEFLDAENRPRVLAMTAGPISTVPRREARLLEDGVVLLRFDEFDRASVRWFNQQLKAHRPARAVVIDLRYNHGGLVFALTMAVADFFPQRMDVGAFIRRNGRERDVRSFSWRSARYAGEVAVLIDQGSASSAEIFAHVLRHHQRAVLVGRPTAGAVIAAQYYSLPDGGRLQVPVRDYIGLDGRRLEGEGVKPDIVVPLTLAEVRRGNDPDLAAALAALRKPNDLSAP